MTAGQQSRSPARPAVTTLSPEELATFVEFRHKRRIRFSALVEEWLAQCRQQKARSLKEFESSARRLLIPAFGSVSAEEITTGLVEGYIRALLGKGLAPKSVRKELSILSTALNFGISSGALEVNPVYAVRPHVLPSNNPQDPGRSASEVLLPGQCQALIFSHRLPVMRRRFWALLLFTGARFGEAAALTWGDYARGRKPLGELLISRSWQCRSQRITATKTSVHRRVPVHPLLKRLLEVLRALDGAELGRPVKDDDLLAPYTPPGQPAHEVRRYWSESTALREWHLDLEHVGVPALRQPHRIHSTRHTFITLLMQAGANERAVRNITHTSKTTRSAFHDYVHLGWDAACEAVMRLPITAPEPRRAATPRGKVESNQAPSST